MKPFASAQLETSNNFVSIDVYQKIAWWQHISACSLVPTGFKTSVDSSAWGTAEREAVMEMMGKCQWVHSMGECGIREQGNSSIGGQWTGCPYQWGWRLSCRGDLKDTRTRDATNPECWCWDVSGQEIQADSRQLVELQLPLQSTQWERTGWQRRAWGGQQDGHGMCSQPLSMHSMSLCWHLSFTSHLNPASDHHWLSPDPHLSGARLSCLTDSPVPCLT